MKASEIWTKKGVNKSLLKLPVASYGSAKRELGVRKFVETESVEREYGRTEREER